MTCSDTVHFSSNLSFTIQQKSQEQKTKFSAYFILLFTSCDHGKFTGSPQITAILFCPSSAEPCGLRAVSASQARFARYVIDGPCPAISMFGQLLRKFGGNMLVQVRSQGCLGLFHWFLVWVGFVLEGVWGAVGRGGLVYSKVKESKVKSSKVK